MNTTETQPPDSLGAATGSAFPALENAVLEYLDALDEKQRVERIDDLLHRLNFERRLTLLASNQREAMNDRTLHPTQRARLDACKTEAERDKLISEMARSQYFRDCAWVDYLNGGCAEPPVMPNECMNRKAGLGVAEENEEMSEYVRDDEKYEYVEQRHMMIYPSEKAGWEQIFRRDGMVGKPSFYVWRRPRGWREPSPGA